MGGCGRDCSCRDVSRREFLQIGAGIAAAAGVAAQPGLAVAGPGDFPPSCQAPPPAEWFDALVQRGEPPMYQGEALKHVSLPLGGIGTGTVWLHGTGRLIAWQIFNNINRSSQVDDTFFAVRIEQEGRPPIVRALQMGAVGPFKGIAGVRFVGQYPFAFADLDDPDLPARIRLEAFNPMIPLNDRDSGIPCAIFRITATPTGNAPMRISFLASAQNAVGHQGVGASVGVDHSTYGLNVNRVVKSRDMVCVRMHAEPGVPAELSRPLTVYVDHELLAADDGWPVRNLAVRSVGASAEKGDTGIYWIARGDVARMGGGAMAAIAAAVRAGATLLLTGADNPLLGEVKATLPGSTDRDEEVFATFDGGTYGPWKADGTAFGEGPAHGTASGQNPVSGYLGGGLVNTFLPNDVPQGTLTSPAFTIRRRYITFLIGGGNHPGKCCLNLRVDGRIVRSATGRNDERLERQHWDVQDLLGKEAVLEIVDAESGGWGHVNVDDIRFGNLPTESITESEAHAWNELLPAVFAGIDAKAKRVERVVAIDKGQPELAQVKADRLRLGVPAGREPLRVHDGTRMILRFEDGVPAMFGATRDKGRVFLVPADTLGLDQSDPVRHRDAALSLVAGLAGVGFKPAAGRPESAPSFGTMCLATPTADATFAAGWRDRELLYRDFAADGALTAAGEQDGPTEAGATINAALATSVSVTPGMAAHADFVLTWHFPNQYYPQESWRPGRHGGVPVGNAYVNWFRDAASVASFVVRDLPRLREQTERFRRCLYDSTLPHYLVDCVGANASIVRSPTCFRIKDGTFYGFEGCGGAGGCCPMNCNHVWNYEHSLSRLWPSLERNMRVTELVYHQEPTGALHHRVGVPRERRASSGPVADGQCGAVLKAYREHLQSPGREFLNDHWERIRKAMDFAITNWDSDADGVMDRPQFNTYDEVIHGFNTFVGSLYLAALRAAEEMAKQMNDTENAKRYRGLYEKGRKFAAEKLFNGEYYIQIADNLQHGYGKGCFSDQVVGQWWARVLDLGDILPVEQVRSALASIYRYSWLTSQKGFQGTQRFLQFADGDDKALLICSWPKGDRPPGEDPIYYRDEAWTGVEYQVAAHMIYEGMLREGLAIVRGARERYNGLKRNPWNEIECGDYYARAMSSWTLLLAAQGFWYDGPAKTLGFHPRLTPDDHGSFFSTAESWGQFLQRRTGRTQTNTLAVAYGRCEIARLDLSLPSEAKAVTAEVSIGSRTVTTAVTVRDGTASLRFAVPVVVQADEALAVRLAWS